MNKRGLSFLILALLLLTAGAGRIGAAQAQETTDAFATLTGTALRLVDQTIVDGYVVDETEVPVTDGRIAIPELGIDEPLAANGTFRFTDLPVSADSNNPTEVTVIFTAPNLGSFTYLYLRLYPGPAGPILTPQMIATPRVNDRRDAHLDRRGAEIDVSGDLPQTGGGGPLVGPGSPVASGLLALVGVALLCVGSATRVMSRQSPSTGA